MLTHNTSFQINLGRFQRCHSRRAFIQLLYLWEVRISNEYYEGTKVSDRHLVTSYVEKENNNVCTSELHGALSEI